MKSVVFDVGNVLIDWDAKRVFRKSLEDDDAVVSFMAEVGFHEWNLSLDAGRDWDEAVSTLQGLFPHHAETIADYHLDWHSSVSGEIASTVSVLNRLRKAQTPLYAITNFSHDKWLEAQERFAFLKDSFLDVVVSGKEILLKPDPAIFKLFLERNNLHASDCVFIDDSEKNIAGARALGFDTIQFFPGLDLFQALSDRGIC